ncbi:MULTISPECIES: hypothetical protein [unclassified Streptococcus]|uniref:hypothetical protein n=1 Tax=unclassified Streptococcus TaxID=2608887 RepID=UPI000CF5D6D2
MKNKRTLVRSSLSTILFLLLMAIWNIADYGLDHFLAQASKLTSWLQVAIMGLVYFLATHHITPYLIKRYNLN